MSKSDSSDEKTKKVGQLDKIKNAVTGLAGAGATAAGIATGNPLLVIGGATAVFSSILNPTINEWRNQWFEDLRTDFQRLEKKVHGFNFEEKLKDPKIAGVVIEATLSAIKTHKDEKKKILRNAVLNITIGTNIEEDIQIILLKLIDDLSPSHVKILQILADPEKIIRQIVQGKIKNFNIPDDFNNFYLKIPPYIFSYLINDLKNMNLLSSRGPHSIGLGQSSSSSAPSSGPVTVYGSGPEGQPVEVTSSHTPSAMDMTIQNIMKESMDYVTPLGLQFLDIIKDPF